MKQSRTKRVIALGMMAALAATATGELSVLGRLGASPRSADAAADPLAPQPLPELTVVRTAISSRSEVFLAMLLADAMGEFAKENIELEVSTVPTSESTLLLTQGELDVVPTSLSAGNLNLVASGARVAGVFPLNAENDVAEQGFWIRRDALGEDGEYQPEDLIGQRVLTPSGGGSFSVGYFWATELEPLGIAPDDVTWERFGVPDTPQALISGAAPAALVLSPGWQIVKDDGCCIFLDGFPSHSNSFYAFGPNLLDEHPEVGEAFVRALARTVTTYLQTDYHNDPDMAATVAEILEQPVEMVQSMPSLVWEPTFELRGDHLPVVQEYFALTDALSYDEPLAYDDLYVTDFITPLLPDASS